MIAVGALWLATIAPVCASQPTLEPKPGAAVPRDAALIDASGRPATLGALMNKPTILVLDYMRCPSLCGLVLSGLFDALETMPDAGRDYAVLSLSIDPRETPADAAGAAADYRQRFPAAMRHAQFYVGADDSVARIADSVGFGYSYDDRLKQYVHPAVITVLTADGKVSGYLDGTVVTPAQLVLALDAASQHTISASFAKLRLLCSGGAVPGKAAEILLIAARTAPFAMLAGAAMVLLMRRRRLS